MVGAGERGALVDPPTLRDHRASWLAADPLAGLMLGTVVLR